MMQHQAPVLCAQRPMEPSHSQTFSHKILDPTVWSHHGKSRRTSVSDIFENDTFKFSPILAKSFPRHRPASTTMKSSTKPATIFATSTQLRKKSSSPYPVSTTKRSKSSLASKSKKQQRSCASATTTASRRKNKRSRKCAKKRKTVLDTKVPNRHTHVVPVLTPPPSAPGSPENTLRRSSNTSPCTPTQLFYDSDSSTSSAGSHLTNDSSPLITSCSSPLSSSFSNFWNQVVPDLDVPDLEMSLDLDLDMDLNLNGDINFDFIDTDNDSNGNSCLWSIDELSKDSIDQQSLFAMEKESFFHTPLPNSTECYTYQSLTPPPPSQPSSAVPTSVLKNESSAKRKLNMDYDEETESESEFCMTNYDSSTAHTSSGSHPSILSDNSTINDAIVPATPPKRSSGCQRTTVTTLSSQQEKTIEKFDIVTFFDRVAIDCGAPGTSKQVRGNTTITTIIALQKESPRKCNASLQRRRTSPYPKRTEQVQQQKQSTSSTTPQCK